MLTVNEFVALKASYNFELSEAVLKKDEKKVQKILDEKYEFELKNDFIKLDEKLDIQKVYKNHMEDNSIEEGVIVSSVEVKKLNLLKGINEVRDTTDSKLKSSFCDSVEFYFDQDSKKMVEFMSSFLEEGESLEANPTFSIERLYDKYLYKTDYDVNEIDEFIEVNMDEFLAAQESSKQMDQSIEVDLHEKISQIQEQVSNTVRKELGIDMENHWEEYEIQLSEDGQKLEYIYPNMTLNVKEMHQIVEKFGKVNEKQSLDQVAKKIALDDGFIPKGSLDSEPFIPYKGIVDEIKHREEIDDAIYVEDFYQTFVAEVSTNRQQQTEIEFTKTYLGQKEDFPFEQSVNKCVDAINGKIEQSHVEIVQKEHIKKMGEPKKSVDKARTAFLAQQHERER